MQLVDLPGDYSLEIVVEDLDTLVASLLITPNSAYLDTNNIIVDSVVFERLCVDATSNETESLEKFALRVASEATQWSKESMAEHKEVLRLDTLVGGAFRVVSE